MNQRNTLPQQNPIMEKQLEELLRREFENITFHPAKPEIPDNPSRGRDHEEDRSVGCNS